MGRISGRDGQGFRHAAVALAAADLRAGNDCRRLGMGYEGLNLLNPGDGGPARILRLGELYHEPSVLPRTESPWSRHHGTGWDGRRWAGHAVDGRVLASAP